MNMMHDGRNMPQAYKKDRFMNVENAAELIAVSIETIRKWIKQRKIRVYRFGGAVRIRESDLLAFAKVDPGISKPSYSKEICLENDPKNG